LCILPYGRRKYVLSAPLDLATFHEIKGTTRCIDCHTGPGITGRVGGLIAGASDLVAYFSGRYPQLAVVEGQISDGNCLKCHATIAQKQDMSNHFHVFLSQWQKADPNAATCVSCHNGHNLAGDEKIKFLNEKDTVVICKKCHAVAGAE